MESIQIPALFKKIVQDVNTSLVTSYNFLYGPASEIVEQLKDMSKAPTQSAQKYPLIALFTDIVETHDSPAYYAQINANLIIATITEKNYRAEERYTNIFIPTLQPIYEALLSQIVPSRYFLVDDETLIQHTKIDRLNWGRSQLFNDGQGGVDFIDAIEIQNLNLKVKNLNCKQKWPSYI